MGTSIKVAVIRSGRRRGAVAQALALLAPELASLAGRDPEPMLIPDLQSPARRWACTHHDTLSAVVDAVLAGGCSSVKILGSADELSDRPESLVSRLGYPAELWGRPARFLDPGSTATWAPIRWIGSDGQPCCLRIASAVAAARGRIVIATPRTHAAFRTGLGLASLARVLHPDDQRSLGLRRGPGMVPLLESARGRLVSAWLAVRSVGGGMRLTGRERRQLESLIRANNCLSALAGFLRPSLSLVDGFSAMHGEGPRYGRRLSLSTVVAGTDSVAVDAVAATLMGFEPMEIAHLREAHRLGLGTADLAQIEILGDAPGARPRRLRRHSSDPLHQLLGHVAPARPSAVPRPHFGTIGSPQRETSHAHRD